MFWMRNKEYSIPICTLIWSPELFYRRLIGIRKKDSIGHRHHPKMMRGLAGTMSSMSNYDSPRYVMHGTGRGSMLDDVEESSSDSEEESSGSDTDSTSEEVDTDTKKDVGDGPKLGPKEQW